ncbi:MAG: hypothetical protein ACRD2L_07670, partial [Terriglobia bacterium]
MSCLVLVPTWCRPSSFLAGVTATTHTYDANGNRLTETRARTTTNGVVTLFTTNTYDAANRLVAAVEPDGLTNRFAYHLIGKLD